MTSNAPLAYYATAAGQALLARQARWLVVAAVLTALAGVTDLDRQFAGIFFDATTRSFPLMNDWWLKDVLHDAARTASAMGALTVLAATCLAWSARRPTSLRTRRRELAFMSGALFAAAALVGTLKHFSMHACPWDVADFGGSAAYLPLLGHDAHAVAVQGCLPAAHPLTGYAWLCVGFVLYPASAARARAAWLAAATLGTLFGFVQIMRGAHFLSHVLWSAWTVWAVDLALLATCSALRSRAATRLPAQLVAGTRTTR